MPDNEKKKIEKIKEIFSLDINRHIEEIIKVDQTDEGKVYNELQEYIITETINDYFEEILDVYNQTPQNPTENVGIWVSGFFGSGKSSFAKILGLILENKNIKSLNSSDLFLNRTRSDKLTSLLLSINSNIDTGTIVFDISKHRSAKDQTERMTLLMYKMFLKHLGYSEDLELAKLEMDLEEMDSYQDFIEVYEKKYKKSWISGRKIINFALNEASVVLNEIHHDKYPTPDSWAKTKRHIDISAVEFSKQLNHLLKRRKKPSNLIFIIDEVGQYISRSSDKMLDLQAIVESFGISDQGKVWIVVTSQEKLDEVVDSLEGKRIDLAKIQDRFQIQVDLAPRDISEVTSKRILMKTPSAEEVLRKLFKNNKNIINTYTKLESDARKTDLTEKSFVNLYPFLPYQIDLIIDIISGIRSQPGASKQTGGSNRTVIKLAQQVLIHPRTNLSEKEIGYLVTLDMIYDLIEGNLYDEIRYDISKVEDRHLDNPMVIKVAKTICILQFVRDLPRSIENISAVLYPYIGAEDQKALVEEAIKILLKEQVIRESDGGFKLQSTQEKKWETERSGYEPDENDFRLDRRRVIEELFSDYKVTYQNFNTFNPNLFLEDNLINDKKGPFDIDIQVIDEKNFGDDIFNDYRNKSRENENKVYWLIKFSDENYNNFRDLIRSNNMIKGKERDLKSDAEGKLLQEEKSRQNKFRRESITDMKNALINGKVFFRGSEHVGDPSTNDLEIYRNKLFSKLLPVIFPKFEIGKFKPPTNYIDKLIKSTSLSGLPDFFYQEIEGHSLIKKVDDRYIINTSYPLLEEVFNLIKNRQSFGTKVSGKIIETNFSGLKYGWKLNVIILAIILLLRANKIEIISQGKRYRTYSDIGIKEIFKTRTFRASSISLRDEKLGLQNLSKSAKILEELYGKEIEIEETAIWKEIKENLNKEIQKIKNVANSLKAYKLPGIDNLNDLKENLEGILKSSSDDAIIAFSEEGDEFKDAFKKLERLSELFNKINLPKISSTLDIKNKLDPILRSYIKDENLLNKIKRFEENLSSDIFFERLSQIYSDSNDIKTYYKENYNNIHKERDKILIDFINQIKIKHEWQNLTDESQKLILKPLNDKMCEKLEIVGFNCENCKSSYEKILLDLSNIPNNFQISLKKYEEILQPEEIIEYFDISSIRTDPISSIEDLEEFLQILKEKIEKKISENIKVILK